MGNKKKSWIICFGSKWESPSMYTEKHIVKMYYKKNTNILWINPIPIRRLSLKGISRNKSVVKKITNRIKTHLKIISRVNKGFYQVNPFFIPSVENETTRKTNLVLLKIQINLILFFGGIKNFGVIASGLTNIPKLFPKKEYKFFIQISGDLYSDLRGINNYLKERIQKEERSIFNSADKILAASNNIYDKIKKIVNNQNKLVYFPHGVDYNHFQKPPKSKKILKFSNPIAGYFGSLTDANDQRMFMALAEAGFSVVLIGKVTGNYSNCAHNNIHFLGPIDYEKLPNYAKEFDIAIMAWKPADWINNCNPSKTLEYFALGKPIISNTIPELKERFSNYIYFADDPDEFVKMAQLALSENNEQLVCARKNIAQQEDWEQKFNSVFAKLKL